MPDEEILSIEIKESDGEVVITIVGELDPYTSGDLDAVFAGLATPPERVVLDLAGVGFIDSAGLRVILSANQLMELRSSRLILRSPSETALRILEITALLETLTVE
ncbi:MAG: STAS domain-containing protein [Aquihabitans sp.]